MWLRVFSLGFGFRERKRTSRATWGWGVSFRDLQGVWRGIGKRHVGYAMVPGSGFFVATGVRDQCRGLSA